MLFSRNYSFLQQDGCISLSRPLCFPQQNAVFLWAGGCVSLSMEAAFPSVGGLCFPQQRAVFPSAGGGCVSLSSGAVFLSAGELCFPQQGAVFPSAGGSVSLSRWWWWCCCFPSLPSAKWSWHTLNFSRGKSATALVVVLATAFMDST